MQVSFHSQVSFFHQFVLKPRVTGAIAPSSTALARAMVEWLEIENSRTIIEYGPGTGVFTQAVLPRLASSSKFFMIETNPKFVQILRARFPDRVVYKESVLNVRKLCEREGAAQVDCIISGLPWASFSESFQDQCLAGILDVLKPRGQFVTFAYLHGLLLPAGRRFNAKLEPCFHVTRSKIVWRNLPPAFVYRCRR